jgi:chorismate synthase
MDTEPVKTPPEPVTRLRPGHADLAGALKYGHTDLRNVIERASSRETAARVAAGSICRQFLSAFGVTIHSHVISIAEVGYPVGSEPDLQLLDEADFVAFWEQVESSEMHCASAEVTTRMTERIQIGKRSGDTCGGVFEVVAAGVPPGLGSYSQWDRRLSARIGEALLSIPSAKGIEIGSGFAAARLPGSQVHDIVRHDATRGWYHITNHAGGIEGGISNGEPIVARVAVKPIPTLAHPLPSADLATGDNITATRYERSDVCVVPAAGVVGEAMLALTLTDGWLEKFGGDNLDEIRSNYLAFRSTLSR